MRPWQTVVTTAFAVTTAAFALACGPDDPPDTAPDLFRLAVNGLPGGALLSVYGDERARTMYLVGGYVGVDPSRLGAEPAGRMMTYNGRGTFRTLCTTSAVLWWTAPVDGVAWAAGERGTVVRYRDGGACDAVDTGLTFAEGAPTYWGFTQLGGVTWFVGGSASPTGPKGVLVRYDGTTFSRVEVPPAARDVNLYKIAARTANELVVVGEHGVALRLRDGVATVDATNIQGSDDRLFTASCSGGACWAVGGQNTGILLQGTMEANGDGTTTWRWMPRVFEELNGWNGVWFADPANTFIVGVNGQTMHTNGLRSFTGRSLTQATLHAVGGWSAPAGDSTVVVAVGGELDTANTSQRAVVLVRGDDSETFRVDGRMFTATGELRRSLGGSGQ